MKTEGCISILCVVLTQNLYLLVLDMFDHVSTVIDYHSKKKIWANVHIFNPVEVCGMQHPSCGMFTGWHCAGDSQVHESVQYQYVSVQYLTQNLKWVYPQLASLRVIHTSIKLRNV